jgi:uncharacterized protein (TIGR04255 family)
VNKLPKKINPDNILQTVAQIRFKSSLIEEARFGAISGDLSKEYPNIKTLVASRIPPDILKTDKALEFIPLYSLSNDDNIVIQIGFNMVSICVNKKYIGWDTYKEHIKNTINISLKSLQITKITRIGLYYINFYPFDIFDKLKIKISNNIENIQTSQYLFFVKKDNFTSMIECRNDGLVNEEEGSMINIDTFRTKNISNDINDIMMMFNNAHKYQKDIYFKNLLSDEYLQTLQVEY